MVVLVPHIPPVDVLPGILLIAQERAFPLHEALPYDKVYLSFRQHDASSLSLHPHTLAGLRPHEAHAVAQSVNTLTHTTHPFLAQTLWRHAQQGHPVHLLQAHLPHQPRQPATRLKLYCKRDPHADTTPHQTAWSAFGHGLPAPFNNPAHVEMYATLFPSSTNKEAYSFTGDLVALPPALNKLRTVAEPCQIGCDSDGTRTWYFPVPPQVSCQDAIQALQDAVPRRFCQTALQRLDAFLRTGWSVADVIVQEKTTGEHIPIVHLIDPFCGAKEYSI